MKKRLLAGIILCTIGLQVSVSAMDFGAIMNGAVNDSSTDTTSTKFGDITYAVPSYYDKEAEDSSSLKFHVNDNKLIELSFYSGDYTLDADFDETKKSIVESFVNGTENGNLGSTRDSELSVLPGINFDFTSTMYGIGYNSYGGYFYNEVEDEYILIVLSVPDTVDSSSYKNDYDTMVKSAKMDDDDLENYANVLKAYGKALDNLANENYGAAFDSLGDLYKAIDDWD